MMKEYKTPFMEVIQLYCDDVIRTSNVEDNVTLPGGDGWVDQD